MRTATVTLLSALIVSVALPAARAAEQDSPRAIACWDEYLPQPDPEADKLPLDVVELTTGNADIQAGSRARFAGPVEIRSGGRLLKAGSAEYDSETGTFETRGGVEFSDAANRFSGASAVYNAQNGELSLEGAAFELGATPARGTADGIYVRREGVIELDSVAYTSCPPGRNDWELRAKSIELDSNSGMGTARGASLRFKGVPFLYLPWFTYPITDDRKSGLLFPSFGSSDRRGLEFTQPVYWNVRPNYDVTFEPRYMSKRGLQLGLEQRLLTQSNEARLWLDYLGNDDRTDIDRWRYNLNVRTQLPFNWRATTSAVGVSDDLYYEDLSSQQSRTSRTHLNRSVTFEYYDRIWSLLGRFQGYQTIDPLIAQPDEPYQQLPQFIGSGVWRDAWLGLDYRVDGEANYFYRKDSVTGARLNLVPSIELPMESRGLYLRPRVAFDLTGYQLQDTAPGANRTPSRAAPIATLDGGAVFERIAGDAGEYVLTLEPRALYAYIPFRDQTDLPVFDTIRPNFNLVQLYRYNRFVGPDRLSDSNQVSIGVTSRVIDSGDGRELITATIGQTLFIDSDNVTLPGETASIQDSTDYIAELGVRIWKRWEVDFRYQYDTDTNSSARTSVRLKYRPGDRMAFNVAYRYVRESVEQTDFSFSYPVGESWNVIGRYNWSVPDGKALDQFFGVEYNSCCWGISFLARSTVSRSTGETDTSVGMQFSLKGFSNFGSGSSGTLERDILDGTRF